MTGKSSPYLARRAKKLKRVKKDYQKKCLSNPFFRQRHNNNSNNHSRRHYCWLGGLILFFVFLFYLFFISSVFTLRTIKVQGISRLPEDQISTYAWTQSHERRGGLFKQNNLFFFKTDALAASLAEKFSFDSLQVHKKWPHTLVVSVSERALAFIWRDANGRSFGDSRGCLVKDTNVAEADLANYPILEAAAGQNHFNQQNCLDVDKNYLQVLFSLNEKLKNHPDLKTARFLLEGEANTLKIDLSIGPDILFNTKDDLDKQLQKLIIIKQEKSAAEFNGLNYIDLRYGDRAYFK